MTSQSSSLLQRVTTRLRLVAISRVGFLALMSLCCAFAIALVVSRTVGVLDGFVGLTTLAGLPLLAAVAGWLLHRRPTLVDAARCVDRQNGSNDLFLTVAMLDRSAGQFQPLVEEAAEKRAVQINSAEIVPLRFKRVAVSVCTLLALLCGVLFLPQWDLIGYVAAADDVQQQQRELEESRRAIAARIEAIQRHAPEEPNSKDVKLAVAKLEASLKEMKPKEKPRNNQALAENQKELGKRFRENAAKLKSALRQNPIAQQFGLARKDEEHLQKLARDLKDGSTESLQKEIDSIEDELQRLMKTEDSVEKSAMQQNLRKRLQDLADLSRDHIGTKATAEALKRAIEQLQLAKNESLSKDALDALSESLDLTKLEFEELAQSIRDLKELENALKTLAMAKRLNDKEKLDGKACEECKTLADYEALYQEMLARAGSGLGSGPGQGNGQGGNGEGNGNGTGGRGTGRGGKAPEDDAIETAFKTERSRSAITAGKVLLTLKTRGLGKTGDTKAEYRDAVRELKQGVSEAIEAEETPPGYRAGIQKYFDDLEDPPKQPVVDKATDG